MTTPPLAVASATGGRLERRIAEDLRNLCYPPAEWVPERHVDGERVLDVMIVGAGMCGALAWFALRRAGISNMRIIDSAPEGEEGPWLTYARMETLRSPKQLPGPSLGVGSLTFRAWHEDRFGAQAWETLDKIPRPMWAQYLYWYRKVLGIPVENGVRLERVEPHSGGLLRLTLSGGDTLLCRKLITATGRDGMGRPNIPDFVDGLDRRFWAHSADDIDFAALKGRDVVVVGVGASAVDNAAEALEAGAREVRHLIRRDEMPCINKMMGVGSPGFNAGYRELSDEMRWRIMQYSFATQTPAPRGSTLRVSRHENAFFHFGIRIRAARALGERVRLTLEDGRHFDTDFVILGTGFQTDPMSRVEFGEAAHDIRLWRDVYTPPEGEQNDDLGGFPYLDHDFRFTGKSAEADAWLRHVFCFNYGASASIGKVSGDIPGISKGAAWLADAVVAQLYGEDALAHWQILQAYSKPELQGDEWVASPLPCVEEAAQ